MKLNWLLYNICIFGLIIPGCNNINQGTNTDIKTNNSNKQALITFDKTIHDFGKIAEGEIVSYTFFYTNSGNTGLVIKNVKTSCGCTTSGWTQEPVKPGERGKLEISFDSTGKSGKQFNEITVYSNSNNHNFVRLTIKAEII